MVSVCQPFLALKKIKEKINSYIASYVATPARRKALRKPEYPEMEDKLYKWFQLQREKHATFTTNFLREKALKIFTKCYKDKTFIASRGWISRFKNRRGIRQLKVVGEKLSSDSSAVQPFLRKFTKKMTELNVLPSQIYNADESALFWKLLPDRTLVHAGERTAPGRKTSKERVTFLACTNGDGTHKLKMLVIGKAKNPRAFKNCACLPVEYFSTKNAWMTSALFVKWFHDSFVKQVRKFQAENNLSGKAILLIDNAPSHASETKLISDDGEIITMFLPPNCIPLIQPMDQNAIRLTKVYYRKSLLEHVLSIEEDDISKALKNISIKDAVFMLANAWDKLSANLIAIKSKT
nr:jerky protein homolog-like [Onthophagus taurus]